MTWSEFLSMGGYGAYVWSAYGLSALVLIWNLITPRLRWLKVMHDLKRLYRKENLPS